MKIPDNEIMTSLSGHGIMNKLLATAAPKLGWLLFSASFFIEYKA